MKREIKFRAWDNVDYMSSPFTLKDIQEGKIQFTEEAKIMQFTGLRDKNGKEIYEGDILELKYPLSSRDGDDWDDYKLIRVAITFQSGSFWFTCEGFTDCNWHFYNESERQIIGNIHENPELLNK